MHPRGARPTQVVPLREATRAWFRISLQTFGGPAGQIAVMQRELVDERRWLGERRFLHALSYCMLLPGPEAQQLAVYAGWLLNGWLGGLVAGVLFVLPGLVALLGLSWLYVAQGDTVVVTGLFLGLAPAVVAVVLQAVLRIGGRALRHPALVALAVGAFLCLAVLDVPFPAVVLGAGLVGWLVGRRVPTLGAPPAPVASDAPPPLVPDDALHHAAPGWRRNIVVLAVGVVLWVTPVALAWALGDGRSVYTDQGVFFGGMALVTFGGAYAVLSYVAEAAVETYGWLGAGEMARGLALAESTPGPLIMVVQFVAFLGGHRDPGGLDPWLGAVVASLLVVWVTFLPSFLFIYLGAPYVERLRGSAGLTAALAGVTAAVVGVIANLALFFAVHTLFSDTRRVGRDHLGLELPVWSSWSWPAVLVAAVALVLVLRLRWSVLRTLGACALLGLALHLATT
ncbi:chromate efflux transporter [Nocardioides deserti]|uniref:Chromate efflux transporter n=1 Tax=Nocardioides deserti TaxID=1588644 RepID=A0ABR6UBZ0_9ACTN|nr:chromate efflux transporter [Nocardioides deserti]MBC2961952.1 chromate efflux transporter [Nocardioides deserti]GGO70735.1 chromate transporter [Nocardioides deserti]